MGRPPRADEAGGIYHALNRGNARQKLFFKEADTGYDHVYQGRYKSFSVQRDDHFHVVCRYVERNALTANLVKHAEDYRWE